VKLGKKGGRYRRQLVAMTCTQWDSAERGGKKNEIRNHLLYFTILIIAHRRVRKQRKKGTGGKEERRGLDRFLKYFKGD